MKAQNREYLSKEMLQLTLEELNEVADLLNTVYKNRGYVLVEDVQAQLDECGASLVESNHLMGLLAERGCKITDDNAKEDDLSLYNGSYELVSEEMISDFTSFYNKDSRNGIKGLGYSLEDFHEGVLFYAFLRLIMGLSKKASSEIIVTLQEAYNIYLPEGEDKSIFDIQSAGYVQTIMDAVHNRKRYKKIRASHKNALGTYQLYLTKNKHQIIRDCIVKMSSKV